jgi:hypothetical protein
MARGLHLRRRRSRTRRKGAGLSTKHRRLGRDGRDSSSKEMFRQLLIVPLGSALTLETFVAPSSVLLRQVFTTEVCVKMFGEELGPGRQRAVRGMEPASGPRDPLSRAPGR